MSTFPLKPTHAPVKAYYAALAVFQKHGHTTEGNTRSAFADLLKRCCSAYGWTLIEEYSFKGAAKQALRADGALVDELTLVHGIWEAKDTDDHLESEIKKKRDAGYPLTNILFQSPQRAVLYQDNRIALDADITRPEHLVEVLECFFEHRQAHETDWEEAVLKFGEKIPDLANAVTKILEEEDKRNPRFREAFAAFVELCRESINPDLAEDAVRKMLVQHILTVRIFTRVFQNEDFVRKNVIAAEIEKVIDTIAARYFSRSEFLKPLDRFYTAIEKAAESQTGYTEKQHFLNAVYEKFFQRFDKKQADTHGIVYTPQPIVDFMVRSVEEILQQEFGKSLSDSGVHILDPFTGTGNFITRIIQQIKRSALPHKYASELHCNEIMLLPYYIASMNIEHAYHERVGEYAPFDGICLVDTFSTVGQANIFSTENTKRIRKQMIAPVRVVIGNPPYNANQANEHDQAKNQKYTEDNSVDARVRRTYTKDSKATLRNKLSDPYVKAFRWASDRIQDHGIVCFVSNSSFIDQRAFDGMRKHLAQDFSSIYVIDLGGNVRLDPTLSGTTHNVFGIQVGVAITLLVRRKDNDTQAPAEIYYARMPQNWHRTAKLDDLDARKAISATEMTSVHPSANYLWLREDDQEDFSAFVPLRNGTYGIFTENSLGVSTNRDATVYGFNLRNLREKVAKFIDAYNSELDRFKRSGQNAELDGFVDYEVLKWSRNLKRHLQHGDMLVLDESSPQSALYRPYTKLFLYNSDIAVDEPARTGEYAVTENFLLCLTAPAADKPFMTLASCTPVDLHLASPGCGTQAFPFWLRKDGERRENITDWALNEFRSHYSDNTITKWDIFHATYAVLHHPEYRTRYAANLKRELPRIPFPPGFHAFAAAGKRLMELHIDYEKQPEYKLEEVESPSAPVSFRVEKMRINPKDKSELRYNDFLTLRGIPLAAYDYRLGNRSALEWVVDQYRVSKDERSGIANDPNREDDPKYILRLIKQVITVSIETQRVIASLPSLQLGD